MDDWGIGGWGSGTGNSDSSGPKTDVKKLGVFSRIFQNTNCHSLLLLFHRVWKKVKPLSTG